MHGRADGDMHACRAFRGLKDYVGLELGVPYS